MEATRLALTRTGATRIAVAVSGGKDSIAVVDNCVRHFGAANVTGFLMYLIKDLDVEWRPIRALERKFKIKVVGLPHWDLSRYLKNHVLRPYTPECEKLRVLKQADIETHVRKLTGADWIAWGMRAADSVVRNAYLKKIQGVDEKQRRVYPIWTWKKADVYGYLHARKLPVPKVTGGKKDMGGVGLDEKSLRWLREHWPADYAKLLKVFPLAEGVLLRSEFQAAREGQSAEASGG